MKKTLKVPNLKNIICTLIQSKKKWLSPSSLSTLKWVRKNELNFVKLRLVLQWSLNSTSLAFFHLFHQTRHPLGIVPWYVPFPLCLETFKPADFLQAFLVRASFSSYPFRTLLDLLTSPYLSLLWFYKYCGICIMFFFSCLLACLMSVFSTRLISIRGKDHVCCLFIIISPVSGT